MGSVPNRHRMCGLLKDTHAERQGPTARHSLHTCSPPSVSSRMRLSAQVKKHRGWGGGPSKAFVPQLCFDPQCSYAEASTVAGADLSTREVETGRLLQDLLA